MWKFHNVTITPGKGWTDTNGTQHPGNWHLWSKAEKEAKNIREIIVDTPPDLCYNPIPEGAAGNMKLPRGCVYCRHKFECHADSNNGKGLRVFKYSKGYTYLTQTVKTPKVLEVTK